MEMETSRLLLRNYRPTDIEDFWEIVSQEKVGPMCGWPRYTDRQKAVERLQKECENPMQFAIWHKEDNRIVGAVTIMNIEKSEHPTLNTETNKELGAYLHEAYWGQGIIPEALNVIINYAFNTLKLESVVAGNFESNTQSGRVQEKTGFKVIGKIKNYTTDINGNLTDLIQRQLTREVWEQRKEESQCD